MASLDFKGANASPGETRHELFDVDRGTVSKRHAKVYADLQERRSRWNFIQDPQGSESDTTASGNEGGDQHRGLLQTSRALRELSWLSASPPAAPGRARRRCVETTSPQHPSRAGLAVHRVMRSINKELTSFWGSKKSARCPLSNGRDQGQVERKEETPGSRCLGQDSKP